MAFVEIGGKRHPLPAGEMLIGSGADCHLRLEGRGVASRHAVLTTAPDQSVAIRACDATVDVAVNGVRLGALPQPLLHGDKIALGSVELLFVDERKSGSTQYIAAVKFDTPAEQPKAAAPGRATAGTGGRVVCLTDGREYRVVGAALTFGRDAKADVVVPGGQVSRRHAEIVATPRGYMLVDYSTNGTWVNGERVQNQRLLARGEVVKVGDEEFRFYADLAPAAPAEPVPPPAHPAQLADTGFTPTGVPPRPAAPPPAPPPPAPAAPPPAVQAPPVAQVPPPAQAAPAPAPPAAPARQPAPPPPPAAQAPPVMQAPPPPPAPAAPEPPARSSATGPQTLAKFVIRSGPRKGERLLVKVPIVNIGRADYNDLVLADESVSSQHAKLTRREGIWILTDLGSTNGTLVDGERIEGDTPLAPGCFVRFGDVQLVFEPTDDKTGIDQYKATRAIQAVKIPTPPPPATPPATAPPPPAAPPADAKDKKKGWFPFVLAGLLLPAASRAAAALLA